ncbi:tyrosine-type recombinase/integrase [Cytobacillus sp. SAFR-174]|uniref:tyrosine-type recombinase/integrase n=1 Tax=Cytobacillus sp. SAFR-174 TaxID=3436868 RepID=UPI003F821C6C
MDTEITIKQFILDNQLRLAPETLKIYQCAVKQLLKHTGKPINSITKSDICYWLSDLNENGYKPKSVYAKVTGVKSFFNYCLEEEFILKNPAEKVPFPRVSETLPYYLNLEQVNQVRHLLNGRLQERAIFEVLYATGVRISELSAMKKEDINWIERIIRIPRGKWKAGRIVLFTRDCSEHLKVYLESRKDDNQYVFLSPILKDRPIHPNVVGHRFRDYSKKLGFRITPHTLRHTFAAQLAQRGMPLECIQVLLGHEDPQQTRYYARLYGQARKVIYDQYM